MKTGHWRSSITICSAPNLFFGMIQASFQDSFFQTAWYKKAWSGQERV